MTVLACGSDMQLTLRNERQQQKTLAWVAGLLTTDYDTDY